MATRSTATFEGMRRYLDFTGDDERALRELAPTFDGSEMIETFYSRILTDPEARRVFRGDEQVEGLKKSLVRWLERILSGPWDQAYAEASRAIGHRHVAVGLPQRFMPLAMNVVRAALREAALATLTEREQVVRTLDAIDKVLDLELTLMLESYHREQLETTRDAERLRTVGQLAGGIGHELKNPLGAIQASLALIRRRSNDPELVESLDRIGRGARMAGDFANRLLEFSRVKDPRPRAFPVRAVVDEALARVGDVGDVDFRVEVEPPDAEGKGDPSDLARALADLIANAVTACREFGVQGTVTVRAHRSDDDLVLEVSDDGPGIPREDHERIFEPLYTTRRHATGLGLALCRELVVAHGGSVGLESEPGEGARFLIRLPQD